MSSIFPNGGGILSKAGDRAKVAVPFAMLIQPDVGFSTCGVATEITATQQVAAQISAAFSGAIYVTPFGDLPGDLSITFMINPQCGRANNQDGKYDIISRYLQNRVRPSTPPANRLIRFSLGGQPFIGPLMGMSLRAAQQSMFMATGTLIFKVWPG